MKKLFLISAMFLCSIICFSQTSTNDSVRKAQIEANKFVDSVLHKTTLADFNAWLYENVSEKMSKEGKFTELYGYFIQAKYNEWIKPKLQAIGASGTYKIQKQKPK